MTEQEIRQQAKEGDTFFWFYRGEVFAVKVVRVSEDRITFNSGIEIDRSTGGILGNSPRGRYRPDTPEVRETYEVKQEVQATHWAVNRLLATLQRHVPRSLAGRRAFLEDMRAVLAKYPAHP